jgi:hypothetical protein
VVERRSLYQRLLVNSFLSQLPDIVRDYIFLVNNVSSVYSLVTLYSPSLDFVSALHHHNHIGDP